MAACAKACGLRESCGVEQSRQSANPLCVGNRLPTQIITGSSTGWCKKILLTGVAPPLRSFNCTSVSGKPTWTVVSGLCSNKPLFTVGGVRVFHRPSSLPAHAVITAQVHRRSFSRCPVAKWEQSWRLPMPAKWQESRANWPGPVLAPDGMRELFGRTQFRSSNANNANLPRACWSVRNHSWLARACR